MRRYGVLAAIIAALALSAPAFAQTVSTVGPNCKVVFTPSVSPNIAAYDVFVGTTSGSYGPAQRVAVADVQPAPAPAPAGDQAINLCAIANLTQSRRYFVTLAAINSVGTSSLKAVEVPFDLDATVPDAPLNLRVVTTDGGL